MSDALNGTLGIENGDSLIDLMLLALGTQYSFGGCLFGLGYALWLQ